MVILSNSQMQKNILLFLLLFSFNLTICAQCKCVYTNDFSTSSGWTMNGVGYTIGPSTFNFNSTEDAAYNYATHPLNCTLSDSAWTGDIDFKYTARGWGGIAHTLLALTSDTLNSFNNGSSYAPSHMDVITAYINCAYGAPQSGDSLYGRSKDGNVFSPPSKGIAIPINTNCYIRLQRLSQAQGIISLFTDSLRTIHAAGSPQYFLVSPNVDSLNMVEHGNIPQGWYTRQLTGTLDNTYIHDDIQEPEISASETTVNVFTPNSDGKNDQFFPLSNQKDISNCEFSVYDRWGKLVFKGSEFLLWSGKSFNGVQVSDGIYFWSANIVFSNCSESIERTYKGFVSLLR